MINEHDVLRGDLIRQEWAPFATAEHARTAWLKDAIDRLIRPRS